MILTTASLFRQDRKISGRSSKGKDITNDALVRY